MLHDVRLKLWLELFKTFKFETCNIYYHACINLCLVWVTQEIFEVYSMNRTQRPKWQIINVCGYSTNNLTRTFLFFRSLKLMTISCCMPWYKSATKIGSTTLPFSRDMLSVIFPPESLSVLCKWKIYMTILVYFHNSHGQISLFSLVQNKLVVHFIKHLVHSYMVFWSTKCVQGCICIYWIYNIDTLYLGPCWVRVHLF